MEAMHPISWIGSLVNMVSACTGPVQLQTVIVGVLTNSESISIMAMHKMILENHLDSGKCVYSQ
jgi:hypothetical protein